MRISDWSSVVCSSDLKICPDASVKWEGVAVDSDSTRLPRDEVVTHVYQLQNVSAAQLVPILRPLLPQWAHLAAYQANNTLIIADRAAHVRRLVKLNAEMDPPGHRAIDHVHPQYATAAEVLSVL